MALTCCTGPLFRLEESHEHRRRGRPDRRRSCSRGGRALDRRARAPRCASLREPAACRGSSVTTAALSASGVLAPDASAAAMFDAALAAGGQTPLTLRTRTWARPLPLSRWCGSADEADSAVLDRYAAELPRDARVLDLGCGPGRHTEHLTFAGQQTLGVDSSPTAVALTRRRGALAVRADALGPLAGSGHGWTASCCSTGTSGSAVIRCFCSAASGTSSGRRAASSSSWTARGAATAAERSLTTAPGRAGPSRGRASVPAQSSMRPCAPPTCVRWTPGRQPAPPSSSCERGTGHEQTTSRAAPYGRCLAEGARPGWREDGCVGATPRTATEAGPLRRSGTCAPGLRCAWSALTRAASAPALFVQVGPA